MLKDRPWTFNNWTMLLDRWVPSPPKDFLSTIDVWVRISNIPMNYYTLNTMKYLASKIGHVIDIAYDLKVSQKETFIRAHVRLDITKPATEERVLNLPAGGKVLIKFDYEKLRKKCFHCLRLTHERPACPMLRSKAHRNEVSTSNTAAPTKKREVAVSQAPVAKPSVPPGFELVFPELTAEERGMALQ